MNKIELLAPAGDLEKLKIAYLYGSDACYVGGKNYSMRANAKNFSLDDLKEATEYAHKLGKKIYVTVNIVLHPEDEENLLKYLKTLEKIGVDALIISDMGVLKTIKDNNLNIKDEFDTFMRNERKDAICKLIDDEQLDEEIAREILSEYEFSEQFDNALIKKSFTHLGRC